MKSSRSIVITLILSSLINGMAFVSGFSQNSQEQEIKSHLAQLGVEFLFPVEKDYNIKKFQKSFAMEDYKITIDKQEVLVFLYEEGDSRIVFPHIEFVNKIAHLATNDEQPNIYMYDVPLDDGMNWMGEARFTPKSQVSSRKYATAKAFYKEGRGMYLLVYLDKKLSAFFEPVLVFANSGDQK